VLLEKPPIHLGPWHESLVDQLQNFEQAMEPPPHPLLVTILVEKLFLAGDRERYSPCFFLVRGTKEKDVFLK